jgi:putative dehydrogenase
MSTQVTAVGVIGLGLLGLPIAIHLRRSGFDVVGFDTDPGRRSEAADVGVKIVDSNRDVASGARTMISVLPHADAFRAVCEELKVVRDGERRILADVSTLQIEEKAAAAKSLLSSNVTLLDCPVLGTSAQAHAGELVMCASGPPDAYEEAREV